MSFRLTVANKTLSGFALLAITILIVGIGGLRSIDSLNKQIQNVIDENIPEVVTSYVQSLNLSEANVALLTFLQSENEGKMQQHTAAFERYFNLYNAQLEQSYNQKNGQVTAILQQSKSSSNAYYQAYKSIVVEHKSILKLNYEITDQNQKLRTKVETIINLSQKISALLKNNKPALKKIREFTTYVNQVLIATRQYQLNGDIDRLFKDAERTSKLLNTTFKQLLSMEKKARFINQHLKQLLLLIKPDGGLLLNYRTLYNTKISLDKHLLAASKQLQSSQQSADKLVTIALQGTQDAKQIASSTFTTTNTIILSLIIASLIIASVIGYLVMITIQRPLKEISEKLKSVGAGDMTIIFNSQRNDEFGVLGADLNLLVSDLRTVLQQIIEKSNSLEQTANKNSKISHETTNAMSEQTAQLGATSLSAKKLEESVAHVSDQVNLTLEAVANCNTLTQQANTRVVDASRSIASQAQEIEKAAEQSKQLEISSSQIDGILGTINAIADQTNLLALNAAIEAARAGDHGRGFAVVADEVRALASNTQNSTAEIQITVDTMKHQIKEVAKLLQNTHLQATACVSLSDSSSLSITQLQQAITDIQIMSTKIAQATQEQNETVFNVSHHLDEINTVSKRTATGAQEVEQSSDELLEISIAQQTLTNRFQL